jgi:hypothetical protein
VSDADSTSLIKLKTEVPHAEMEAAEKVYVPAAL